MTTTYSFQDVNVTVSHPAMGTITLNGNGFKSISLSRANDMSSHDLAGDGAVMINKMASPNGTVGISVQQTSPAHDWFVKLANYIENVNPSEFAKTNIVVRTPLMKALHTITGVTPQKRADKTYANTGGDVTWNMLGAKITDEVI